jgi:hypothetical protein
MPNDVVYRPKGSPSLLNFFANCVAVFKYARIWAS